MLADIRVAHCSTCGKVFQKNIRNMCGDCAAILDKQYDDLDRYLIKNRKSTTDEASHATGVPVKQIHAWIRQNKISLYGFPNLSDGCDMCGGPTRQGHLCTSCSTRLKSDIIKMHEDERSMQARQRGALSYKSKQI